MRTHILIVGILVLLAMEVPSLGQAPSYPELIPLPAGFGPEGIAVGNGHTFYVGSLAPATLGQILVGDLRTGTVSQLVAPTGRPALGMKHDPRRNLLFVAGGGSGTGVVYDASSGDQVAFYQFQPPSPAAPAPATTFINDVVVTRDAAYFTDSSVALLYRVALGPRGQPSDQFEPIYLPANFGETGGCLGPPPVPPVKANGIVAAPSGRHLILGHLSEGQLYWMNTATYTAWGEDSGKIAIEAEWHCAL
jgi:hypothetical protein